MRTEWGLSKNSSLVGRQRPPQEEATSWKRPQWEGSKKIEARQEPTAKRQREQSPEPGKETENIGAKINTGANTPVSTKVKRLQGRRVP